MEESAPVQAQSEVMCHPSSEIVIYGAFSSLEDHIVIDIVSMPAVESLATGSPFILVGSSVIDAL